MPGEDFRISSKKRRNREIEGKFVREANPGEFIVELRI
jgi:hypothetical protein